MILQPRQSAGHPPRFEFFLFPQRRCFGSAVSAFLSCCTEFPRFWARLDDPDEPFDLPCTRPGYVWTFTREPFGSRRFLLKSGDLWPSGGGFDGSSDATCDGCADGWTCVPCCSRRRAGRSCDAIPCGSRCVDASGDVCCDACCSFSSCCDACCSCDATCVGFCDDWSCVRCCDDGCDDSCVGSCDDCDDDWICVRWCFDVGCDDSCDDSCVGFYGDCVPWFPLPFRSLGLPETDVPRTGRGGLQGDGRPSRTECATSKPQKSA